MIGELIVVEKCNPAAVGLANAAVAGGHDPFVWLIDAAERLLGLCCSGCNYFLVSSVEPLSTTTIS